MSDKVMYPTNLKTYNYIVSAQERLERAKNRAVSYAFTILFRLLFAVTLLLVIFGMALFVFFVFYYFTLPTIRHVLPVHFEYADCSRSGDTCEYPNATVPFTHGKAGAEYPILMAGQKYAMWLRMDFPESQENLKCGLFMVRLRLRSQDGLIVKTSSRPALLRYRSYIHHVARLIALFPLYLLGYMEERQNLQVDLIESYQEDPYSRLMEGTIQIRKSTIEIYKAELHVEARLEGLRYWMHRHPVIIGSMIVIFNSAFGVALAGLSAYNRFAHHTFTRTDGASNAEDFGFDEKFDPIESPEMDEKPWKHERESSFVRQRTVEAEYNG